MLLGLKRLDLDVRIGEFEQHGFRPYRLPRLRQYPIDAASRKRCDEPNMLGHERTRSSHLAQHIAPARRVHPESRPVHAGRSRLQAPERRVQ